MLLIRDKRIEVTGVSLQYDRTPVLENIDLTVYDKDFLAITGPNGGGKKTLLRFRFSPISRDGQPGIFRGQL